MNGAIRRTRAIAGWLLLAACAGGCVRVMPMADEGISGLLEPAPVRVDLAESDQPDDGPVFVGESCLDSAGDEGAACPIVGDEPPRGPLVGVRVLLCRLFSPLRCIRPCLRGRLGGGGVGGGGGGGEPVPVAEPYHHSRFHPIPTQPVFDPRDPPFLAMDGQPVLHESLEPVPGAPVPGAPVPDEPRPTKAVSPEARPSSAPPTRLEVIPTPPATDAFGSGGRTVLSQPRSQSRRDTGSLSWVFHPPVLRDPEPTSTAAQLRRRVSLETESDRVTR
ncbi:MAG: hypothetical protein GY842_00670 [bacterium]|nr:hypothetical protein [bacterium]